MATFTIVPPDVHLKAKIKVVGIGGAGGNALNSMMDKGLTGVDFVAVNTDSQDLKNSRAYVKLQIGNRSTQGLGAGGNPDVGEDAAIEDKARIAEVLDGSDMVFIAAGMGGGTGTGASPVVSKVSKEVGALTIAIVTTPFDFEGKTRVRQAFEGLNRLEKEADTLIVVPNDKLYGEGQPRPLLGGFLDADNILFRAISGITEIINSSGYINVDFADVRTVMSQDGSKAIMGTGSAEGADRAVKAAETAVESPFLGPLSIEGAKGVLLHIIAPPDFGSDELKKACEYIQQKASKELNFIFGLVIDKDIEPEVSITIIATGIKESSGAFNEVSPSGSEGEGVGAADKNGGETPPVRDGEGDLETPAYLRNKPGSFFRGEKS